MGSAAAADVADLTSALAEPRPRSAGDAENGTAPRALEDRPLTPDVVATSSRSAPPPVLGYPGGLAALPSPAAGSRSPGSPYAGGGGSSAGGGVLNSTGSFVGGGVLGSEAEQRYVQAIQHFKESIVREQHTVRMLQAARATAYSKNSEYEEFFLKCIDEARKEQTRKRHMTLYKEKGEKEQVLEAMLNNEDVLVCLYEKLFPHRSGIARSLGGGRQDEARLAVAAGLDQVGARRGSRR